MVVDDSTLIYCFLSDLPYKPEMGTDYAVGSQRFHVLSRPVVPLTRSMRGEKRDISTRLMLFLTGKYGAGKIGLILSKGLAYLGGEDAEVQASGGLISSVTSLSVLDKCQHLVFVECSTVH